MIFVIPMILLIHHFWGDRIQVVVARILNHINYIHHSSRNHFLVAPVNLIQRLPYISASLITTII